VFGRIARAKQELADRFDAHLRNKRYLKPFRIDEKVAAEEVTDGSIRNMQILVPADARVPLGATEQDHEFLKVCKYFNDGFYSRPSIFTCEVPEAYYHVGTGLLCTRNFKAIEESQFEYRLKMRDDHNQLWCKPYEWFKPLFPPYLKGTCATINNVYMKSWGHWITDSLPRLHSLKKAYPDEKIELLVPNEMGAAQHESLDAMLPENFTVRRMPAKTWVKVERMLLPSYVVPRANCHMPQQYYDFVKNTAFARLGLPPKPEPRERIYVSRAGVKHRRLLNEDALIALLQRYGFRSVLLTDMKFRDQVDLFRRAEAVVTMEGSNCADIMFAGKIKLFILYPNRQPNTHWFTCAKGLGQEHFFIAGEQDWKNADYSVDLAAVERVLREQMGYRVSGT
jgi:hypothetical protein